MLGLEIVFDLGRYHANPWGTHVNDAATEWPPSPWRILRGLYSASCTQASLLDRREDVDRALTALARADPPAFELPHASRAHTRHYMPVPEGKKEKSTKVLDGFLALAPGSPLRVWWDVNLDAAAGDALAAAGRAMGYLGRSESVCTARLIGGAGPEGPAARPLDAQVDASSEVEIVDLLCVEGPDPLAVLTTDVGSIRKQRYALPPGTRFVPYAVPTFEASSVTAGSPAPSHPQLALFRIRGGSRPSLPEAVAMGQLLRNALQSRFGRCDDSTSVTFSGGARRPRRDDQHQHAHYLSLPDRHGRRIDRLLVWAEEGFGSEEVAAIASLGRLWQRGDDVAIELRVALGALGRCEELRLPRVLGPAKRWRSLTPFGLPRHQKVRAGRTVESPEEQVRRELAHRGLPSPDEIEIDSGASWHRFRSSKVGTSRARRATLVGVRLGFAEPVRGPIALGALSHYGLGLMQSEEAE
jgi:CRISPR-associated protein Csb2